MTYVTEPISVRSFSKIAGERLPGKEDQVFFESQETDHAKVTCRGALPEL